MDAWVERPELLDKVRFLSHFAFAALRLDSVDSHETTLFQAGEPR
jgi:hypothetical protein